MNHILSAMFISLLIFGVATGSLGAVEPVNASLVITGPGDPLYTYWGHVGLLINSDDGTKRFYDFGNFSFYSEKFFTNFAMGRMPYIALVTDLDKHIERSIAENRDLKILPLDIGQSELNNLDAYLKWKILPENREYLYHYFLDNCSTIIRDLLNIATKGTLKSATENEMTGTFREFARIGADRSISSDIIIHFLLGPENDIPISRWNEMFLPKSLGNEAIGLSYVSADGLVRELAGAPTILNQAVGRLPQSVEPRVLWPGLSLVALFLGLGSVAGFFNKSRSLRLFTGFVRIVSILLVGVPGLLLTFLMLFTDHSPTYNNLNLLLGLPTILIGLIPAVRAMKSANTSQWKAERFLSVLWAVNLTGTIIAAILRLSGTVLQDNSAFLAFVGILSICSSVPYWFLKKAV